MALPMQRDFVLRSHLKVFEESFWEELSFSRFLEKGFFQALKVNCVPSSSIISFEDLLDPASTENDSQA